MRSKCIHVLKYYSTPGLPNTTHIPHCNESGAPHYHLPMPSHKASGLYWTKPLQAIYRNITVDAWSEWLGVVGFGHATEWRPHVMACIFWGIWPMGGSITPGQIAMGLFCLVVKIKHTSINHWVARLGLNWQWDGMGASFAATKNRGKIWCLGGGIRHGQMVIGWPIAMSWPSCTPWQHHNQSLNGWMWEELAREWRSGCILWCAFIGMLSGILRHT